MDKRNFAFGRVNFIMMAVSMLIVVVGFILMSGGSSDEHQFNPEIFSTMRVKVAPIVCFIGFVSLIAGIMKKPKSFASDGHAAAKEETLTHDENKKTVE